jgi:D-alanyl-D-alanine endopeptidase (penicillin-binding protein 7)
MLVSNMLRALPSLLIALVAAATPVRAAVPGDPARKPASTQPELRSASVLVLDTQTSAVLLARKADQAVPIASITKLMTALVVVEANQPMDQVIAISADDLRATRGNRSHLAVGTKLTRAELLHLALMASENRAANALGRSYPGGLPALLRAMNARAGALGMNRSHFVEPTGLSSRNVASPQDLTRLVAAAARQPTLRRYSTDAKYSIRSGGRELRFVNTNLLVRNSGWDIDLQKTGYISEGGQCLVMKTLIEGRDVIIVLLNSFGKYTRTADARRIRKWMESTTAWRSAIAAVEPQVAGLGPGHR